MAAREGRVERYVYVEKVIEEGLVRAGPFFETGLGEARHGGARWGLAW